MKEVHVVSKALEVGTIGICIFIRLVNSSLIIKKLSEEFVCMCVYWRNVPGRGRKKTIRTPIVGISGGLGDWCLKTRELQRFKFLEPADNSRDENMVIISELCFV